MSNWPLLSILIWLPMLGGALILAMGNARASAARWTALGVALLTLTVLLAWGGLGGIALIAAAPEMYAIIDYFVQLVEDGIETDVIKFTEDGCFSQAKALLAKIDGGE